MHFLLHLNNSRWWNWNVQIWSTSHFAQNLWSKYSTNVNHSFVPPPRYRTEICWTFSKLQISQSSNNTKWVNQKLGLPETWEACMHWMVYVLQAMGMLDCFLFCFYSVICYLSVVPVILRLGLSENVKSCSADLLWQISTKWADIIFQQRHCLFSLTNFC